MSKFERNHTGIYKAVIDATWGHACNVFFAKNKNLVWASYIEQGK